MFDFVFLYRDCLDGTLRGWMLGGQSNREKDGKHFCVMRVSKVKEYSCLLASLPSPLVVLLRPTAAMIGVWYHKE